MSGSAYLDAIAAAHPTAAVLPGSQTVAPGTVSTYADIQALIASVQATAQQYMYEGAAYATSYVQHIFDAMDAARAAVLRANSKAAPVIGQDNADAVTGLLKNTFDTPLIPFRTALAMAVYAHAPTVNLPTYGDSDGIVPLDPLDYSGGGFVQDAYVAAVTSGYPVAANFRDMVVWYMSALQADIAALQGEEAAAVLLSSVGGPFSVILQALGLVADAIQGLWNLTKAVAAAAIAGVNLVSELVSIAPYAALAVGGYFVATKTGLLGGKKAA